MVVATVAYQGIVGVVTETVIVAVACQSQVFDVGWSGVGNAAVNSISTLEPPLGDSIIYIVHMIGIISISAAHAVCAAATI